MKEKEFQDLMVRSGRRMMIAALRVTGRDEDAKDAVQEAMIRLWENRRTLASADSPEAYATKVAQRCAIDIVRRRHQATSLEDAAEIAVAAPPVDEQDQLAIALKIIDRLPEQQREVMTLRHLHGLEIEDIKNQLNLSAGNVRVILSRARAAVRKCFEL